MFGEQQRLETLEWSESAIDLLYDLMGSAVEPRKRFIMNKVDFSNIRE